MDVITGNISPLGLKVTGLISQSVLRGYSAYQVALQNGFEGSMEQWLYSLRGESIEFRSEGLSIYYKYESDTQWNLLVEIDQLLADYSVLDNKPSINSVELNGNKTLDDLGIQAKGNYVEERTGYSMVSDQEIQRLSEVDNYDDSEIRQAIEAIVLNAVTGVKGVAEAEFRKGNVTLTPANLGLGNVDNTHDADKSVYSAVRDSDGNVIYTTYFSGVREVSGEVFLVRPDGTMQKIVNSIHNHDASQITSGTIDIARLPAGALERMVDVANRVERYALTTATVQNGDTVRQLDTGVMYRVVDDTKLNKADGYKEYTAGRASVVPWSGIEDKPLTFAPSAHTHEISDISDIANASVYEATKLKTGRTITISGGATAAGVLFDGTTNIILSISDLNAVYLSGTASIDITGNSATTTQFARERTIEITGKATAAAKVYDGRQNIALQVTDLDAAPKSHTHTMSQITDLSISSDRISDFETSNTDAYLDIWFSDSYVSGKPVHNSGIQYNPFRNILKAGTFQGSLTGNASTASALTTNAGSVTHPVYFANGVPVATTYELNATVPADAVFTDTNTHYASDIVVAGNFNSKVDTTVPLSNGNVYINHVENNQVTSSRKISGTGTTTVTADEYGNIIINATGNDYTQGSGISIANYVITNTGVRAISESTENGSITVNTNGVTADVPVHGLGTAAYTDATAYAASNHSHAFSSITNKPTTLSGYGITDAASSTHGHDASDITSGVIDIARLPAGAIEKLVVVANQAARFALTKTQVQNGDTVQQEDTGVMYRVVDDNYLDRASGYKEYVAGTASSVPWTGVTGKPETFTPSTHSHTTSEISDIASAIVAKANQLTTARTISLTGAVTGSGSFDGSENLSIETTVNHTHQYAGSQTIGGPANEAVKLTTSAGSTAYPVYFYEGKPVALAYQLNATVPADAVFTDTHYASATVINSAEDSTTNSSRAISNGNVFINHVENGVVKSSHRIIGTGVVTVTYNSDGDLVINGIGLDPQYMPTLYTLSINGVTYDGSAPVDVGIIDAAHGGTGCSSIDSAPTSESPRMVTSGGVYTALAGKANTSHTHQYAGSSSVGGSATSAEALTSNAGSGTQPIYFSSGKPTATTYSLNATVPADAVFTDTHYASKTVVASANNITTDTSIALTNSNVFINHVENGVVVSSHRISGSGSATVTTDAAGNIVISAEDTKYTVLPNPYALSINGNTYDGSATVTVGIIGVQYGGTGNSSVDTAPTEDSTKMVTSGGVYTALAGKASTSHTHSYAGSSSPGGSATSAVKLDSDAGSATQPVYFTGGKPTACTYSLGKSVPADALFTDTHYTSKNVVGSSNAATDDTSSSLTNTHVVLNHVENGVVTSSHRISGTGATTVITDASGNIIINSSDTKYTELPNPFALTIQANGTSLGTYDGSEAKSFNITYSNVGAAAASHGHAWSDISNTPTTLSGYGITDQIASKTHIHDASEIQSGVFDIARIPVAALERLIVVDDLTEMYTLTTSDVQMGDTVQCEDTGIMYRVVDTSNLDNADGYKEYTAGAAASVPWSGITGKPSEFTPASHTHMYAASATVGGSAISAAKLDSNDGSATNPVYFSGGKPTACTYELNATVPANAVFTDTHHQAKLVVNSTNSATTDTSQSILNNDTVFLNLVENSTVRSSHRIRGGGDVKVSTDSSGNIIITLTDTKYSAGDGIDISGTSVVNTGVRSISTGSTSGTISVNTGGTSAEVSVAGLGSAAYTASTAYAASGHTHPLSFVIETTPTSALTMESGKTYTLSAGGNTFSFTLPSDTKPSAGVGINVNDSGEVSNAGVRSITTGATNGTISVNTNGTSSEVSVYGLGSAAFTDATAYAPAVHNHQYAASSTVGGAAISAEKAAQLQTDREIYVDLSSVYNSSTNHPTFNATANFTAPITGTLGVGNGGTGQTTFTTYGILYGNGTSGIGVTQYGSAGYIFKGNGPASAPGWINPATQLSVYQATKLMTGRVLKVGLSTVYDSTNTASHTFNGESDITVPIDGTLGVGHGGTGQTSFGQNCVLLGNGTNGFGATATSGSAGQVLKSNGNAAPSWEDQNRLVVGAAEKLSTYRTIALTVAANANGGVTGTVSTLFDGTVTLETTLSAHVHDAANDITTGILPVARGGTGYGSIDATPTSGSDLVVKSSGVHKRIAYKKIKLDKSNWQTFINTSNMWGHSMVRVHRQAVAISEITANTQIVSVQLAGQMVDGLTTLSYEQSLPTDGTTATFTLDHAPTTITEVRSAGISTQAYTYSGNKITMNTAPSGSLVVFYDVSYKNNWQFSKIKQAETLAGKIEFVANDEPRLSYEPEDTPPLIDLYVIVGYVSETLDVISTQATVEATETYSDDSLVSISV